MILQFIKFIQQMNEWRKAKRCMAHKHKWIEFDHPYKEGVSLIRCKWCHVGIEKMKTP